jgi:hypothetical protein
METKEQPQVKGRLHHACNHYSAIHSPFLYKIEINPYYVASCADNLDPHNYVLAPEGPCIINDKIYRQSLCPSAAAALAEQKHLGSLSGPRSDSPICDGPLYFCMIGSNRLPGCCSLTASGITFLLLALNLH